MLKYLASFVIGYRKCQCKYNSTELKANLDDILVPLPIVVTCTCWPRASRYEISRIIFRMLHCRMFHFYQPLGNIKRLVCLLYYWLNNLCCDRSYSLDQIDIFACHHWLPKFQCQLTLNPYVDHWTESLISLVLCRMYVRSRWVESD